MKAQIIIIGDELLNGQIQDINGPFLAKWLFSLGIILTKIHIERDDKDLLLKVLKEATSSCELLLITGGLGPTKDDITKTILAEFFNKKLVSLPELEILIKKHYQRINKKWSPDLNNYHYFPKGFSPVENPKGLAPGLKYLCPKNNCLVLCAPGVPRELESMAKEKWEQEISEQFNLKSQSKQRQVFIRTKNIPEEKIFGEIAKDLWEKLEQYGKVSSLPQGFGVDIIITFQSDEKRFKQVKNEINQLISSGDLAGYVWQYGCLSPEEYALELAQKYSLSFSFAESCTGGLCSHRMTELSGCSVQFLGSAVTYSNNSKVSLINVSHKTLEHFGAVSIETAKEMALGSLNKYQSDISIALTGIAGPTGGSEEKPIGTVVIAIATKNEVTAKFYQFTGDRQKLKSRFADQAFFSLISQIINIES